MQIPKQKLFFTAVFLCLLSAFSTSAQAQYTSFQSFFKLDLSEATEAPEFPAGIPEFDFPAAARKNGVEGTLKIVLTLGEDAKVKNITIEQPLPHGVSESVVKSLETLRFQPAKRNGKPIAVKMFFDFVVATTYAELDKNITKPKITSQPAAVYPENQRADKRKGKVYVVAIFYPDGQVKIVGVNSTMPKEFDRAALEAAKNLKFTPAVHKKSKKPVAQQMTVEYDFKP